jgi:PAS domain-containing protein
MIFLLTPGFTTIFILLMMVCLFRDITEKKKADEITKENEERFRALVEHNSIITVLDKDFKVILEVHHLLVSQVIQMMNLRR